MCLAAGCYDVTLDGGPWQNEITWELDGNTGGAPYYDQICVGGAESDASASGSDDQELVGSYINTYYVGDDAYYPDYVNDWHFVEITYDGTTYWWNN